MTLVTTAPAAIGLGVGKSFGDRAVLYDLDVTVARGEFVALLGASGSGKTTLLRILAGLEAASAGDVLVPEVRTVVYQEPRLVASMKVWRNVVLGLSRAAATRDAAVHSLREVGLEDHADAWPGTLSGGEAQRVALARALVRACPGRGASAGRPSTRCATDSWPSWACTGTPPPPDGEQVSGVDLSGHGADTLFGTI
jgi:sulfonate transport system ATP-binding protein